MANVSPGYVYILLNPSLPGLLKIGRTIRDTRQRARKLSAASGIPTPFQVAFELFSEQHEEVEAALHANLSDFRVAGNREFFRYPLDRAISLLQQLGRPPEQSDAAFVAEDITERLRAKYPGKLRPSIVAVRLVQVPGRVWFEITEEEEIAGYLVDQKIHRTDVGFIVDELPGDPTDRPFLRPEDDVRLNANKLVDEFDSVSNVLDTD